MDHEEINAINIQRYLDGEMTQQEQADFENQLNNNQELQQQVKEYQRLAGGIRYNKRMEAWEKFRVLDKEIGMEEESYFNKKADFSSKKIWSYWPVAATVALLVIALFYLQGRHNYNKMFEENFQPYPVLAYGPNRSDTVFQSLQQKAFAAYSGKNYPAAIPLFEEIISHEEDPLIWFYLGNSYLATEESEKAISAFQKALSYETELDTQARWYMSLALIRNNEIQEAKNQLEILRNSGSSYKDRAQNLLKSINNP